MKPSAIHCNIISGLKENNLVAEVLPMMGGFARPYSRQLELGLEDLQLPQLIDQLRLLPESWQRKAVLHRIMASFLDEVLIHDDSMKLLIENSGLIEPSLDLVQSVIQELIQLGTTGQGIQQHHKLFLLGLCRRLDLAAWPALLAWLLATFGHGNWFESDDFEAVFVEALNKADAQPQEAIEFCLLGLQNGRKTIVRLLDAALQNAGQIPSVVSILQPLLEPVCAHPASSDDPVSLLGRQLIERLETRTEKELDNVIELCLALMRCNARYAVEVCGVLPRFISDCWARRAFAGCLVYADMLVKSLNDTEVLGKECLSTLKTLEIVVVLVEMVNTTVTSADMLAGSAADRFALRAVSLTGLNRLLSCRRTEVEPVLERLLAPACRAYFFPGTASLLAAVQSRHFHKKQDVANLGELLEEKGVRMGEIVVILPRLMRCEWHYLFEVSSVPVFSFSQNVKEPVLRIRIHIFLGLPDPDPLVRCMDPDPSIIMQK